MIAMGKAEFNKKKAVFSSKLDLNLKNKIAKWYFWSIALCGAETWKLRKVYLKYLEIF